jgi:hypothetical protein
VTPFVPHMPLLTHHAQVRFNSFAALSLLIMPTGESMTPFVLRVTPPLMPAEEVTESFSTACALPKPIMPSMSHEPVCVLGAVMPTTGSL